MTNSKNSKRNNKRSVNQGIFKSVQAQGAVSRALLTGYVNVVIAGTTNGTVLPNSYVSTTTNWAAYAVDYTQFRILCARLQYLPFFGKGNPAGAGAGVAAVYNGGLASAIPGAPASPPDITAYHDDYQFIHTGKHFTLTWRPVTLVQKQSCATSTPGTVAPYGGFLTRLEGSVAGTVGFFYVQYVVEFFRS